MACESTLISQLLPAISALAGVVISQVCTAILSSKEREHLRNILLREKYEELAQALGDSLADYLKLLSSSNNAELLLHARPAHAQRVDILARLYFPELKQSAATFLVSVVAFQNSLALNYNPKSNESVGVQAASSQIVEAVQKQLEQAKQLLDVDIEKYASKYAIA